MGERQCALENLVMSELFWQNKKVLITGHTGFKGSWLTLWLKSLGAEVVGYSLAPTTQPNLYDLAQLKNAMTSYEADVRHYEKLHEVISKEKPDIVFHLAAQALVRHSYANPVDTYATNVMGTVNLLEALRQTGYAKAAVIVTSDKCYENREWFWGYRETEAMGGYDPYSSSKACAELVASAYRNSFFSQSSLHIATARAGNVIGGGDWAEDRLIPDFLRAMLANDVLKIRNPHAIRPWQHVLESLAGYLKLAENLWNEGEAFTGSWNFGPDDQDAKPVEWVANFLTSIWGENATWEFEKNQNLLHEAHYLKLDSSKARTQLQWKSRWPLEKALQATVDWYKAYRQQKNIPSIMLEQIHEYQIS